MADIVCGMLASGRSQMDAVRSMQDSGLPFDTAYDFVGHAVLARCPSHE